MYNGKWVHFHSMMFLKDVVTPRETESNIPEIDSDGTNLDKSLDEGLETQVTDEPSPSVLAEDTLVGMVDEVQKKLKRSADPVCVTPESVRPSKKKKVGVPLTEFEKQLLQNEKEKINLFKEPDDDDDLHFFKSLMPYFKQMAPIQKLKVRTKIQQIVADELAVWQTSPLPHSGGSSTGSGLQTYNFADGYNDHY